MRRTLKIGILALMVLTWHGRGTVFLAAGCALAAEGETQSASAPGKPIPLDKTPSPDGKIHFKCKFQRWPEVIEWFAAQAGLSLIGPDEYPEGTFNYQDSEGYSATEAINLLNGILRTKNHLLVRRNKTLRLVNVADIDTVRSWLNVVSPDDLVMHATNEMVVVYFRPSKVTPDDVTVDVRRMLGPGGSIVPLPKIGVLQLVETAGNARTIYNAIEGIEQERVETIDLRNLRPQDAQVSLRARFSLTGDNKSPDGSLRFNADPAGTRIFIGGKPELVAKAADFLKEIDRDQGTCAQLEVYKLVGCDPALALAVVQTELAGLPNVRASIDGKSRSMVVLAPPQLQRSVKTILTKLAADELQTAVIQLHNLDPVMAVMVLNKVVLACEPGDPERVPRFEADIVNKRLAVRGTERQILQIQDLIDKLDIGPAAPLAGRSPVRVLNVSARQSQGLVEQVKVIWPVLHANKIEINELPFDRAPRRAPQPKVETIMP